MKIMPNLKKALSKTKARHADHNYLGSLPGHHLLAALLIVVFAAVGAYLLLPSHATSCLSADFNNDGAVNALDLSVMASNWGKTGASQSMGDANGDSAVNIYDLSALASEWGQTCTPSPTPTPTPTGIPPIPSGSVYNVMDSPYNAKGDGVTDDSLAIKAAYLAAQKSNGGTVLLPANHIFLVNTPWEIPTNYTNDWVGANPTGTDVQRTGTITMYGYGATIKYYHNTDGTLDKRFSWLQAPNPGVTWGTYGNLVIEGMNFDNNYRQPSADCGTIFWGQGQANYTNITVRDVKMYNINERTQSQQSSSVQGFYIATSLPSRDQPHVGYTTNITIEDSHIEAQAKPIGILMSNSAVLGSPMGYNPYLIDNILIQNVSTNVHGFQGTGVHLGGEAAGNRATLINVTATDSGDNLIEVDAFNYVMVKDCTLSYASSGVGFTWFSYPYQNSTSSGPEPQYIIDGCNYTGGNMPYWPASTTGPKPAVRSAASFGNVQLGNAASDLTGRDWGDYIVENSTANQNGNDYVSHWNGMFSFDSPFHSVTMTNDTVNDLNIPAGTAGSSNDSVRIGHRNQFHTKAPVTISNLTINATGGSDAAVKLMGDLDLNVDTVHATMSAGSGGNDIFFFGRSITSYTNDFTGTLAHIYAENSFGGNGLELAYFTNFNMALKDSDFSNMIKSNSQILKNDTTGSASLSQSSVLAPGK